MTIEEIGAETVFRKIGELLKTIAEEIQKSKKILF